MNKIKSLAIVLGVLLLASMSSCTKDNPQNNPQNGEFNPGKKIRKIYISYKSNQEPLLSEEWHWNGNKLRSIDHYRIIDDESILAYAYKEEFTYNGNHISRIDYKNTDQNRYYYTLFEYEGDCLKSAMFSSTTKGTTTYEFMYQNEKISQIIRHYDYNREPSIYYLTWEGDNLSTINDEPDKGGFSKERFEYDNKNNPMCGCLSYYPFDIFYPWYFEGYMGRNRPYGPYCSKNNCVADKYDKSGKTIYDIGYMYDEDGYPTKQTVTGNNFYRLFLFEYE